MIDFKTIQVGNLVTVVGAGAPGFAELGETLKITKVEHNKVWARKQNGDEAFFALTCGAARLTLKALEGEVE